jgi:hypothetical protein
MKTLIPVLFIAGLLLGPGYYIYCKFFSGSSVGEYTILSHDVKSLDLGVVKSTTASNPKWNTPVELDLSPEMNPILIKASFGFMQSTSVGKGQEYSVSLSRDGDEVWTRDLSVRRSKAGTTGSGRHHVETTKTVEIMTFEVDEPGTYSLDMTPQGRDRMTIAGIKIDVRKNVLSPRPVLYVPGVIVLVLSLVLTVYYNMRQKKARSWASTQGTPPGQS